MEEKTLYYPADDLRDWKLGLLHKKWYSRARNTFCERDLSDASGQHHRAYHFGEWLIARYYLRRGYQVLPEKYLLPSRKRALKKATELLGQDGVDFFSCKRRLDSKLRWPPNPDLLLFKSKRFFFVEVKRHPDKLSRAQKEFFPMIEQRFHCIVRIVILKPVPTGRIAACFF
jgi:hypothetical protein